ncbi:MAG TPA: hypothetical protein DD979_00310 [Gammaproteobacteria bacterium]|nr:hypothetical protein [Gammaproteobacteria bacterium]
MTWFRRLCTPALAVAASALLLQACASQPAYGTGVPNAQSITDITPGFSYLQEISGPGVTRDVVWVFNGRDENLYRWDLYFKRNSDGAPWKTVWLNEKGAMVRYEKAGNTVSWTPHDCFRVVGECNFQYTDAYGFKNSYVRQGEFNGDTWHYDLFLIEDDKRLLVTNGMAKFNREGVEIFHEYHTSNNGYQLSEVKRFF